MRIRRQDVWNHAPYALAAALAAAFASTHCTVPPRERASGVYAHDSRALVRIDTDYNGDGRIDVRTYLRRGRPVRLEADASGDGTIDRWEYYDAHGRLLRIGGSTAGDGREDMWVHSDGERRVVEISSARDRRVDRREVYEGEALVLVESDTDRDGLSDRWEQFRGGAMAVLMLDDERRHGKPTRRIFYDADVAARVETDLDGDGQWEIGGERR